MKDIESIGFFIDNGSTHYMRTAIHSFQCITLFALLLLSSLTLCYSQPAPTIYSVFQTDSIIALPFNERPINFQICFDGSKSYILDENAPVGQVLLRNVSRLFDDTLQIDIPDTLPISSKSRVESISLNSQYVAISIFKNILLFRREQNSIKYIRFYETRFPCDRIRISNDAIVGVSSRIANVDDQNSTTWLFHIQLADTTRYYSGIKLIEPLGIEFTYFAPQVHVAINNSMVMIADIVNYKIRIYNHYGVLIDSISKNTSLWLANRLFLQNDEIRDSIQASFQYAKNNIDMLRPYFDSLRVLRSIDIINDKNLLVAWQLPERWVRKDKTFGPPKMEYDIWKYENNKWIPSNAGLTDILPERDDSVVSFSNNNYLGFNYYATDEAVYRLRNWIPTSIDCSSFTFNDIYKIQDSIAAANNVIYALFRIKMKSDDMLLNEVEKLSVSNHANKINFNLLMGCNINSLSVSLYSPDSVTLVMPINDYNCHDCIITAIGAIDSYIQHSTNPTRVILLTRTQKSMVAKTEMINKIRKFSKKHQILFDCVDGNNDKWPPVTINDGVFGMFNVSKTPILIAIHRNKEIKSLNYEKMNSISDRVDELQDQIDKELMK